MFIAEEASQVILFIYISAENWGQVVMALKVPAKLSAFHYPSQYSIKWNL
jgi:hypothetical protein